MTWPIFIALLAAIAKLLDAVAWPLLVAFLCIVFRIEVLGLFRNIPRMMDRVSSLKFKGVEAVLSAQSAAVAGRPATETAAVSNAQLQAAATVATDARAIPVSRIRDTVHRLADRYEEIRRLHPSGAERTGEMNQVVAQMRALSLAARPMFDELKTSHLAGRRLMAVVILQIDPDPDQIDWLVDRFASEQPFVFFHTAIALQRLVNRYGTELRKPLLDALATAEGAMRGFDGRPDANTLFVLRETRKALESEGEGRS